ncbi:MAG: PEP-CTERM sorting domain-containing protein [Bryobacteraceae bacterium]
MNTSATPEPGAFGLLASSLGGLILMLRRRK